MLCYILRAQDRSKSDQIPRVLIYSLQRNDVLFQTSKYWSSVHWTGCFGESVDQETQNMVLHWWPRYFSEKNCLKYRLKDRMLQCKHSFQNCTQNSTANIKPFQMFRWKSSLGILIKSEEKNLIPVVPDVSRKHTSVQRGRQSFSYHEPHLYAGSLELILTSLK